MINIVEASLDNTGLTDTTSLFQAMVMHLPNGAKFKMPKGLYRIDGNVKLNNNITIEGDGEVRFRGKGTNVLFTVNYMITFKGIQFENCSQAITLNGHSIFKVDRCKFLNNIVFAAINLYNASKVTIVNSSFNNILKHSILIDGDSTDILIDKNTFDNPDVFGGYATEQISGHVYCLNASKVTVSNNTVRNNGGQGIIFGYNGTTGKGTTDSIAINNICEGNGQEGITSYGGVTKVTHDNYIIGNTCRNNRFHQIEIWESDNNIVKSNTVEESKVGTGNIGAITLYNTLATVCKSNNILSARNNGIAIIAGTSKCDIKDNTICETNRQNNTNDASRGNGILLDWNGVADPEYQTISRNLISSIDTINKSGIYSTSNTNHHNAFDDNLILGYVTSIHEYALATASI